MTKEFKLRLVYKNKFQKELKLMQKRGKDLRKIENIIKILLSGEKLQEKHRNHRLSGDWCDCMECHIEPDWLLIYQIDQDTLTLIRTGTHSDLF